MKIFITHCSFTKDDSLKNINQKVTPDKLYTAKTIQRFIKKCKENMVDWAIFSDLYGIWFPWIEHEWYNKSPDDVSDDEFFRLLSNFDEKLQKYDEIYFYHNPGRFHSFYGRLIKNSTLSNRIKMISHLSEIF